MPKIRVGYILIIIFAALLTATVAYGQSGVVTIEGARTCGYINATCEEPVTTFTLWDPIIFFITYNLSGPPGQAYEVLEEIGTRGKIIHQRRHVRYPGTHLSTIDFMVTQFVPTGTATIGYRVRAYIMGETGPQLAGKDVKTSSVTIE